MTNPIRLNGKDEEKAADEGAAQIASLFFRSRNVIIAGQIDDKLICAQHPPTRRQRWLVSSFFTVYARAKGALNRLRGRHGPTRMLGLELIE